MSIIVTPTQALLSKLLIRKWTEMAAAAISCRNRFIVALSGGKSPIPFYRALSKLTKGSLWTKTHVFLVDERYVSLDHPESNFRMLKKNLIDPLNIPTRNIHPIPTGAADIRKVAWQYERDIKSFFRLHNNEPPVFDLILLGLGQDGHIASLFPGTRALEEKRKWVATVTEDHVKPPRITLTLPVLTRARTIIIYAPGKQKADILKQALEDQNKKSLPVHHIKAGRAQLYFWVDQGAANLL